MNLRQLLFLKAAGTAGGGTITEKTAIGTTVQFTTNLRRALTQCEIEIAPNQPGTGAPSAENPRPIYGADGGIIINRSGVNLYDRETYPITDGYIIVYNTGIADTNNSYSATLGFIPCEGLAGQEITINKYVSSSGGMGFYSTASESGFISGTKTGKSSNKWTVTVPSNAKYFRFTLNKGDTDDVQIEQGPYASTYEPYVAYNTYSIVFPETVGTCYGGTLNVLTGVLNVTYACHTFTGTAQDGFIYGETKTSAGTTRHIFNTNILDRYAIRNNGSLFYLSIAKRTVDSGANDTIAFYNGTPNYQFGFYIKSTECDATVESFNAWIAEHPCQVVFPLATPFDVQLDPVTVQTIIGTNRIFNDASMSQTIKYLTKE